MLAENHTANVVLEQASQHRDGEAVRLLADSFDRCSLARRETCKQITDKRIH